ncbi:MAG: ABC transporter permease subunit [Steroidobacteraceae bacterium]
MKRASVVLLLLIGVMPVVAGFIGTVMGAVSVPAWRELLAEPGLLHASLLSIGTGVASTLLALAVAHMAVATAFLQQRAATLRLAALPALATPHVAIAIGLVLLLAPSGLLLRAVSPWATGYEQAPDWATVQDPFGLALTLGLIVKEVPFLILVLLGGLSQVPADRLMIQGRVLGYGAFKTWFVAVAPLLHRQSRLATVAVLVFGVTNVEMALVLGPTTPPTLSLLVWRWFTDTDLAIRSQAYAGALLMLLISALVVALLAGAAHAVLSPRWRAWATNGHRAPSLRLDGLASRNVGRVVLGLGGAATVALLIRSVGGAWRFPAVWPARLSIAAWTQGLQDMRAAVAASITVGLVAAVIAIGIVLAVAEVLHDRPLARRRFAMLLFIPLVLPQMAFLFGLQTVLIRLGMDGQWTGVLWSHLLFVLPYAWVVLAEARAQLPPGYRIVARTLGAGPLTTWVNILLPQLLRSILVAAGLCFAVSMALYLPTQFAGGGRIVTVTTEAAVAMSSGDLRSAASYGVMQALLPLVVFAVTAWISRALFADRKGMPA